MTTNALQVLASLPTTELLAKFNALTGAAVKRFADRATAEKRLAKALADKQTTLEALLGIEPASDIELHDEHKVRSEAIRKTWTVAEVAAKRVFRHAVMANGVEFSSLRNAFLALGLPESKHIPFRQVLKAQGAATFTFGKKSVKFELVKD